MYLAANDSFYIFYIYWNGLIPKKHGSPDLKLAPCPALKQTLYIAVPERSGGPLRGRGFP